MLAVFDIPWFLFSTVGLVGLVVGSFLNVVILRLPKMMEQNWRRECCTLLEQTITDDARISLSSPNSSCPTCNTPIQPWHNIPIASFIWLRGRCAKCANRISVRYPLIEAVTAGLSLAAAYSLGATPSLVAALVLIWCLIALSGIDLDTQLLPDSITLPLLWLGLAVNLRGTFVPLEAAVIGAMAGYLSLWTVYWLFKLVTGKDGMGYGDFKLLAALGAWFGWQALPLIIVLSSFVGALGGIVLVLTQRHDRDVPIPFGPYLAGAGLLCLFFQRELTDGYHALIGL